MAWEYERRVVIDFSKCGTANTTNFPVLFAGTYSYLASIANGGKTYHASGYDIAFFADEALSVPLNFERVFLNLTTGECQFYVQVPTLSFTKNTVFYIAYGNPSISSDQQNKTATWESGFLGVYHMEGDSKDSTSNVRDGTDTGPPTYDTTTPQWEKSVNFTGATEVALATSGLPTGAGAVSIGCWFRVPSTGGLFEGILSLGVNTVVGRFMIFRSTNNVYFGGGNTSYNEATLSVDTWYRVIQTYDGITCKRYKGGSQVNSQGGTGNLSYGVARIGDSVADIENFNGRVDEAFIYNGNLSASFVTADWNNQNSPSTFYSIEAEQSRIGKIFLNALRPNIFAPGIAR